MALRFALILFLIGMNINNMALALPTLSADAEQMRIDLAESSIVRREDNPAVFDLELRMSPDNGTFPLPDWRQWWHVQLDDFEGDHPSTLHVRVSNAGYRETILPVWSLDGAPYVRVPATTKISSGGDPFDLFVHRFTLEVPAGVKQVRLAKFFPYTIADKNAWLETLKGDPSIAIEVTGHSREGRAIERIDITDPTVPDAGKQRIWIHGTVHPSETTTAFILQGLVAFVRSADPAAVRLRQGAILNIVPMVNPDGVVAGNYRTSTNSKNLEDEWGAPYRSEQPEILALQDDIERFMGTVEAPAPNPIRVLLNLHSAGGNYPFHFVHLPLWQNPGDLGVDQIVHDMEKRWVEILRARSPFVRRGRSVNSRLLRGKERPFVEAMMFDRYSSLPEWTGPQNNQAPVMAITLEGTYRLGPTGDWSTPDDYRQLGHELGLALNDYLGLTPPGELPGALPPESEDDPEPEAAPGIDGIASKPSANDY